MTTLILSRCLPFVYGADVDFESARRRTDSEQYMFDSPRFHPDIRSIAQQSAASKARESRDVEIGGSFDGTFDGHSITVLEGASVTGELGAELVEVHGVVRGKIRGTTIHVKTTGLVEGELRYQTLLVDSGAIVNAHCTPADPS